MTVVGSRLRNSCRAAAKSAAMSIGRPEPSVRRTDLRVQASPQMNQLGLEQVVWPPWVVEDRPDRWLGLSWPLVVHDWVAADAGRAARNEAAINARMATSFMFLNLRIKPSPNCDCPERVA